MRIIMKTWTMAAGVCLLLATGVAGGAQAADMSCAGKNFVFFPGGSEGDSFASIVYAGAKLAATQTGCHVDYVWSDWDPQKMVQQFSEAMARKPTGISVMGHPGEEALGPLIDQAEKAGIIVTTSNVDLPNLQAKYSGNGFGYIGAQLHAAGMTLGNAAAKTCGLKAGDTAFVWGLLGQAGRGQRTQGILDALKAAQIKVEYLEISDAVNKDATAGIPMFASFMASHPQIKMAITDHGALTATIPAYMAGAGKKPGEICGAGFDMSAPTVKGVQDGYIAVVLDQQPFLEGYLPIIQLYLTSKFGFVGLNVDTGAALITKQNVDAVAALAQEGIR
jgi:simple sugar transport system substrate-binding protein